MIGRADGDRIDQQFLDHVLIDQRVRNGSGDRSARRPGVVRDHVGVLDQLRCLESDQLRIAWSDPDTVQVAGHTISVSRDSALIAAAHSADPPRRPWTTIHGMSQGFSTRAILDSAEPTKPTGIPMIAAGCGAPSAINSNRWNSAVGALPIATTAPARLSVHSETAAADRVVSHRLASSPARGS